MAWKSLLVVLAVGMIAVSLVAGLGQVQVAQGNYVPFGEIVIHSPANATTYTTNNLVLDIMVVFYVTTDKSVAYSIDGQTPIPISGLVYDGDAILETANVTIPLPKFTNGPHTIEVYAKTGHQQQLPGTGYTVTNFVMDDPAGACSLKRACPQQESVGAAVVNAKSSPGGEGYTRANEEYDPP
jgi:hypothetical protein